MSTVVAALVGWLLVLVLLVVTWVVLCAVMDARVRRARARARAELGDDGEWLALDLFSEVVKGRR